MKFRSAILLAASVLLAAGCDSRTFSPPNADLGAEDGKQAPGLQLAGRVTDLANILDPGQEAALATKLQELERQTKHQMVVVTVASLGGQDIALYTRGLANRWGIGRKGHDDGVVLLVAPNERQVRIAVGYWLERTLTTPACARIIADQMLPRFRQGDLPGGIDAGTDALIALLGSTHLATSAGASGFPSSPLPAGMP